MSCYDAPCFPPLSKLLARFFFSFIFLPVLKELWGLDHSWVSWGHSINSSWAVSLESSEGGWVGKREADGSLGVSGASKECGWEGRVSYPEKQRNYELIETTEERVKSGKVQPTCRLEQAVINHAPSLPLNPLTASIVACPPGPREFGSPGRVPWKDAPSSVCWEGCTEMQTSSVQVDTDLAGLLFLHSILIHPLGNINSLTPVSDQESGGVAPPELRGKPGPADCSRSPSPGSVAASLGKKGAKLGVRAGSNLS